MVNKTILGILLLFSFLMFVNGILAYTIKIPVCIPNSTINNSNCVSYTNVGAITNAPRAIMYLGDDGNLYLTNDTQIQYTIINNNTNYTNVIYNVTNVTQVNHYYSYTNSSNLTIIQNFTANDTIIRNWVSGLNLSNFSLFNSATYNKSEADSMFAFKNDLNALQTSLANFATKNDINALNLKISQSTPLLNLTGINDNFSLKALQDHVENGTGDFSMTWKVIIIINCFLIVLTIILMAKMMMGN